MVVGGAWPAQAFPLRKTFAAAQTFAREEDRYPFVNVAGEGVDVVMPRRQTFNGMDEIGVREPGGHVVMFAQPTG